MADNRGMEIRHQRYETCRCLDGLRWQMRHLPTALTTATGRVFSSQQGQSGLPGSECVDDE